MKLHRKWDCHERALENLAVQSLPSGVRLGGGGGGGGGVEKPSSTHHSR